MVDLHAHGNAEDQLPQVRHLAAHLRHRRALLNGIRRLITHTSNVQGVYAGAGECMARLRFQGGQLCMLPAPEWGVVCQTWQLRLTAGVLLALESPRACIRDALLWGPAPSMTSRTAAAEEGAVAPLGAACAAAAGAAAGAGRGAWAPRDAPPKPRHETVVRWELLEQKMDSSALCGKHPCIFHHSKR